MFQSENTLLLLNSSNNAFRIDAFALFSESIMTLQPGKTLSIVEAFSVFELSRVNKIVFLVSIFFKSIRTEATVIYPNSAPGNPFSALAGKARTKSGSYLRTSFFLLPHQIRPFLLFVHEFLSLDFLRIEKSCS